MEYIAWFDRTPHPSPVTRALPCFRTFVIFSFVFLTLYTEHYGLVEWTVVNFENSWPLTLLEKPESFGRVENQNRLLDYYISSLFRWPSFWDLFTRRVTVVNFSVLSAVRPLLRLSLFEPPSPPPRPPPNERLSLVGGGRSWSNSFPLHSTSDVFDVIHLLYGKSSYLTWKSYNNNEINFCINKHKGPVKSVVCERSVVCLHLLLALVARGEGVGG